MRDTYSDFVFQDNEESITYYLSVLVEFIFAMKDKLRVINENSYNTFMMRVGEWNTLL